MPAVTSPVADPEWRRERARKGAAVTNSLDSLVRRVADRAHELDAAQRQRLTTALQASPDHP